MKPSQTPAARGLTLATLAMAAALAGCSDDPELIITGTAAKGEALGGIVVEATCVHGSGTATTAADGSFRMVVKDGSGPCLIKGTAGGQALYSFAMGTGSELTGNVTSLTNLLVSYMLNVPGIKATSPEAWFQLPATQSLLSVPSAVSERVVKDFLPVVTQLTQQGGQSFTLNNIDFLTTSFTPSPTASPLDAALQALRAANVVTTTGAPTTVTQNTLVTNASNDPTVPPTTTGGTGAGG